MMTSKAARQLQADLERNREEGNWKKVIESAETLRSQNISGQDSQTATLLLGEGKLEQYLEEHPPVPANCQAAKHGLTEARSILNTCVGDQNKKMTVSLDALLLLAKLEYATGDHGAALNRLNNAGLDKLQEKDLAARSLKILAESFAIKGLCLEQTSLTRTSRYKKVDKASKMLHCFEQASDITLLYLQKQDKISSTSSSTSLPSLSASTNTGGSSSPLPPSGEVGGGGAGDCYYTRKVGPILEASLCRAPTLHIKAGHMQQAIDRNRKLLSAIECSGSQQLRLTVCTQLAELLMKSVSTTSYVPPALPAAQHNGRDKGHKSSNVSSGQGTNTLGKSNSCSEGAWQPRRYTGLNLFIPNTRTEEVILLLLISEAMAVRDAVLTQTPEFSELRERANSAATAVHDMLATALAPTRHYQILIEVYERSMKFSYRCSHVWRQFGLSLVCGRQPLRGMRVLQEVHTMQPANSTVTCLLAAKVALQTLNKIDEGISWVKKAQASLDMTSSSDGGNSSGASPSLLSHTTLQARCCLYHAIGMALKAQQSTVYSQALVYRREELQLLHRASELDPGDHMCHFYLSECYASCRQLVEASHHCHTALTLRPDHLPSLLLLILLLEAQGEAQEALQLCSSVQQQWPSSVQVASVVVSLQEHVVGPQVALHTATHMMALWHQLYKHQLNGEGDAAEVASGHTTTHQDGHSMYNVSEDNDTASVCGGGVESVCRVEFALSEVASSVSGSHCPRPGHQQAWTLQLHCWLTTARLYLKLEQINEAVQCVQEAATVFPMSHQIMFMKGQLLEHKGELSDAQTCYENALAINPHHTTTLRHLGMVYQAQGSSRLAEKTLLDAVKIDPLDHRSWCALGEVTRSLGELERSSECLITALDLQATAPVLPFSTMLPCFA